MSKHWQPDRNIVPLRPGRARREWSRLQGYWEPARRQRLPKGAKAGLLMVAAACASVGMAAYDVVTRSPFDLASRASPGEAIPYFGFCYTGGGRNCVVDGDTFYLGGDKVRIAGIDAPETHPPRCAYEAEIGARATDKLLALLNSGEVTMTSIGRDRDKYGRLLRNVAVNGADVGAAMVGAGVARDYGRGRRSWCDG